MHLLEKLKRIQNIGFRATLNIENGRTDGLTDWLTESNKQ